MMKGRDTVTSGTASYGSHLCLFGVPHCHERSGYTLQLGAACQARQIEVIQRPARVLKSAKSQVLQPAARASKLHLALHAVPIETWS